MIGLENTMWHVLPHGTSQNDRRTKPCRPVHSYKHLKKKPSNQTTSITANLQENKGDKGDLSNSPGPFLSTCWRNQWEFSTETLVCVSSRDTDFTNYNLVHPPAWASSSFHHTQTAGSQMISRDISHHIWMKFKVYKEIMQLKINQLKVTLSGTNALIWPKRLQWLKTVASIDFCSLSSWTLFSLHSHADTSA